MYSSFAFANEFIDWHKTKGGIQHLAIQKLVFSCYGWWLSKNDAPIINETPKTGAYGPYFGELFDYFRYYMRSPITKLYYDEVTQTFPRINEEDLPVFELIDWVCLKYKDCSPELLASLCHRPGTPWHKITNGRPANEWEGQPMPIGRIKEYYEDLGYYCHKMYPNTNFLNRLN